MGCHLSTFGELVDICREGWEVNGGQGRDRTTDTRIFNPLLYQLSYLAVLGLGVNTPDGTPFYGDGPKARQASPRRGYEFPEEVLGFGTGPGRRQGRSLGRSDPYGRHTYVSVVCFKP